MDDAGLVRSGERFRRLSQNRHRAARGQEAFGLDHRLQRLAVDIFHGEERQVPLFSHHVDLHDVRMRELRRSARFPLEACDDLRLLREVRVDDLERHHAVQGSFVSPVDGGHASCAELAQDAEAAERSASQVRFVHGEGNCLAPVAIAAKSLVPQRDRWESSSGSSRRQGQPTRASAGRRRLRYCSRKTIYYRFQGIINDALGRGATRRPIGPCVDASAHPPESTLSARAGT